MAKILVLESSAKLEGSYSRQLTAEFINLLKEKSSEHTFVVRDLAHDQLPMLTNETVDIIRTHADNITDEQRKVIAVSEMLIAELKSADFVVIGSPMYNWNISASLKSWLDQIMRVGMTFGYGENGLVGLLADKPALVIMTRGGSYEDPARAAVDMQTPYLNNVLNLIGLAPTFVTMEGTLMPEEVREKNLAVARAEITAIADTL